MYERIYAEKDKTSSSFDDALVVSVNMDPREPMDLNISVWRDREAATALCSSSLEEVRLLQTFLMFFILNFGLQTVVFSVLATGCY